MSTIGDNYGVGAAALQSDREAFLEAANRWLGKSLDAESAPLVRDVVDRGKKLRDKLEAARKAEKDPHLRAGQAVDAAYKRPLDEVKGLLDGLAKGLTAHMVAEKRRAQEEAEAKARAAEEAARAAEFEAAAPEADPFAIYDAEEAAKVARAQQAAADAAARARPQVVSAEGDARALGLRTYWRCEIENARALVEHFAEHDPVVNAALAIANRVAREQHGDVQIPGCRIIEEKRAA